jgi:nitrogenase molybdenum-iron protein alpha/beta subunit
MTNSSEISPSSVPFNFIAPYLDGAYLIANAIPDICLVYHAHDCGFHKEEKICGQHDLFSDLLRWDEKRRILRTNLDSREYIHGGKDKLSMKIRQVAENIQPAAILVAYSNVIAVTGEDVGQVIRDMDRKVSIPVIFLPLNKSDSDYLVGYFDGLQCILSNLNFKIRNENTLALVGYIYDRNEGDHQGNVAELRRILAGIGAPPGPIFLDGSPFRELNEWPEPTTVIDLAGGAAGGKSFAERFGASCLDLGLPLGIKGTVDWIEKVADFLDLREQAAPFIRRELTKLLPRLKWLLPRFTFGRGVIVLADGLLLPALVEFLEELGFSVFGVACTAGENAPGVKDILQSDEYKKLPLQVAPFRELVSSARNEKNVDLVIGNSVIRQLIGTMDIPFVELGYPSSFQHFLTPSPFLGFDGVLALTERIINALEIGTAKTGSE